MLQKQSIHTNRITLADDISAYKQVLSILAGC